MVTNPDVEKMTDLQWIYEYYALKDVEYEDTRKNVDILKASLVNLLGLNVLRPRDDKGAIIRNPTLDEIQDNIVPLSIMVGQEWFLTAVDKQREELEAIEDATDPEANADYEERVRQVESALNSMDDMSPAPVPLHIDKTALLFNSKEFQDSMKKYVGVKDNGDTKPVRKIKINKE